MLEQLLKLFTFILLLIVRRSNFLSRNSFFLDAAQARRSKRPQKLESWSCWLFLGVRDGCRRPVSTHGAKTRSLRPFSSIFLSNNASFVIFIHFSIDISFFLELFFCSVPHHACQCCEQNLPTPLERLLTWSSSLCGPPLAISGLFGRQRPSLSRIMGSTVKNARDSL